MKRILISLGVIALVGTGVALVALHRKSPPPLPHPLVSQPGGALASEPAAALESASTEQPGEVRPAPRTVTPARTLQPPALPPAGDLKQVVDFALNPGTSYGQRHEIWNRLRESGALDDAMQALGQRAQEEPSNPVIPSSLGVLCLFKAGQMTNSIADQGLLGMTADKMFDQALGLESSNWEARFWKATAMSYWPSVLNKSRDVMSHFVALVEQQEAQTPQPQFVQTYASLGQEYPEERLPELRAGHLAARAAVLSQRLRTDRKAGQPGTIGSIELEFQGAGGVCHRPS